MFKKKKKKEKEVQQAEIIQSNVEPKKENTLGKGSRSLRELFAPSFVDRSNPEYLKVENKYVKSFVINGYPSQVSVGWLNDLYNYEGDSDTALYVEPADERGALDELTRKITQFEAQLQTETEKGNIKNITKLQNNISQLYEQRARLEQNYENLFYIQTYTNLYTDTEQELKKQTEMLMNRTKGARISLMSLDLRQDEGYKSALPFGKAYTDDLYRNFSSGALIACFPFYNSEISHENGVFIGVNLSTMTPVFIDFYDRKKLRNSNFTVFGTSGSGKTFFVSLLTLRSALKGIKTTIIDPEGEYVNLSRAIGGTHVYIAPDSKTTINPFDVEEEIETDDMGVPTGRKVLSIKDKVADILNLIAVMAKGLTREQESLIATVVDDLYKRFDITEDPDSLYINDTAFDPATGTFVHSGIKKTMPTFSDFHDVLTEYSKRPGNEALTELVNSLQIFKKGSVYDMFDCQTSDDIDFKNAPVIVFDVSRLEESILRPIGMYIALSWTWEKFVKKNPDICKRVVIDEAWMLVNKSMAGHEYTEAFLDKAARRIRKRNGGLLVASQSFNEFEESALGRAVLLNASMNIFLKQNSTDIDAVQRTFNLSDGEKNFLLSSRLGEMLIRIGQGEESSVAYAMGFKYEIDLIKKAKLK